MLFIKDHTLTKLVNVAAIEVLRVAPEKPGQFVVEAITGTVVHQGASADVHCKLTPPASYYDTSAAFDNLAQMIDTPHFSRRVIDYSDYRADAFDEYGAPRERARRDQTDAQENNDE